ncbi:MAG: accessory factor associated with RNA polymerase II [Candelina submexicana]|nr:MAG: accessory factor associated with RNA polymerase II [Candelina submexicana]
MASSPTSPNAKAGPSFFLSWTPKTHPETATDPATTPGTPGSQCSPGSTSDVSKRPQPVPSKSQPLLESKAKSSLHSSNRGQRATKDSRRSQARSSSSFNSYKYHPVRKSSDPRNPLVVGSSSHSNVLQIVEDSQQPGSETRKSSNSNPSHTRSASSGSHHEDGSQSHELHGQDHATKDGLPLRDSKPGAMWNLKPAGYWFEEKLKRRTKRSATSTPSATAIPSPASPAVSPAHQSEIGLKMNSQEVYHGHSPTQSGSYSSTAGSSPKEQHNKYTDKRESFLDRSKRRIRALHHRTLLADKVDNSDAWSVRSKTKVLLEMANNVLRVEKDQRTSPDSTLSASGTSYLSSRMLTATDKRGTTKSASSSIRKLLMGKPPVNTPMADALYGGKNANDYFKVEISDPDNPTFLPSEARRLHTPPLPSDGPRRGHRRGFFFDLTSPGGIHSNVDESLLSPNSVFGMRSAASSTRRDSLEGAAWFRMDPESDDSDQAFELNVPEHLPNSPLCPKSPLHKSGGRGICVYHGRNRTATE